MTGRSARLFRARPVGAVRRRIPWITALAGIRPPAARYTQHDQGAFVGDDEEQRRFERMVLPHLGAAYNLARWLTRNDQDASDVVQDAVLRALRYFHSMRGENARPWLLQIVRHTCYSWLERNRPAEVVALDDVEESWREVP